MLTFGSAQGNIPLAALGAAVAIVARRHRSARSAPPALTGPGEHPEVRGRRDADDVRDLLAAEGAGATWPGEDAALPLILVFVLAISFALVGTLRRRRLTVA